MLYQELLCARKNRRGTDLIRTVLFISEVMLVGSGGLHAQTPSPPQLTFNGVQSAGVKVTDARAVAADKAGNIFVVDSTNNQVLKFPAGGGAQTTVGSGLNFPVGVAADQTGNVYIADYGNSRVVRVAAGTQTNLISGILPGGVAVDAAGNVFVTDQGNFGVVEVPAGGGTQTTVINGFFSQPTGVAVDAASNIFVADPLTGVWEVPASGGPPIAVNAVGVNFPWSVAVDGAGNLFISDKLPSYYIPGATNVFPKITEVLADGGGTVVLYGLAPSGTGAFPSLGVDGAGDLLIGNGQWPVDTLVLRRNFGSANVCPAGQSAPAPCSVNVTLSYYVYRGGTIGGVTVLTGGTPNLDFILNSTNCSGYVAADSYCTASVTFAPLAPGLRTGMLQITDTAGNPIFESAIFGQGQGPAVSILDSNSIGSGLNAPQGVAVDRAGDIFIADTGNNRVVEVPAGGGPQTTVGSGLNGPQGVAVDGVGNVFITDSGNRRLVKIPAGGGAQTTLANGAYLFVAVDGKDNLFLTQMQSYGVAGVQEIPAGGGAPVALGSNLYEATGVTVDGAGDVFTMNGSLWKIPAGGGNAVSLANIPGEGIALDAAGNIFASDNVNNRVVKIPAGGSAQTTVASGLNGPTGVAVDAAGNIYIADTGNNRIAVVHSSPAPALSFAATPVGSTSSDSPQSVTVKNIGNQQLNATAPGLNISGNFQQVAGPGTPSDCTSTFSLAPGASCNMSISFTPQNAGTLQGTAVLTDNALNASAAQTVTLSGTGTIPTASVSASSLNFNFHLVGTFIAPQYVTLNNTGTGPLSIASISISSNFVQTNTCGSSLAQGASCSITVFFTPPSAAAFTGTLTITDNNNAISGSVQTVSLTGLSGTGTSAPPAGKYLIQNLNSGLVLGVAGASTSEGANIVQWYSNGSPDQKWTLRPVGNGAYTITDVNSGMVIGVAGASLNPGVPLIQWALNGSTDQEWRFAWNGAYWIITDVNSGLQMDIQGASRSTGAQAFQWTANGGGSQQWALIPTQ